MNSSLEKVLTLFKDLAIPAFAAPLYTATTAELVIEQCKAGIVGCFPALNARGPGALDQWIDKIRAAERTHEQSSSGAAFAPFAVNQVVTPANTRLQQDLQVCIEKKVPIIITSMRAPVELVAAVHGYGGVVFHDVVSVRHAEKALDAGVDGLVLVCAGAGGHGGTLSPFAFVSEIRRFYDGPLIVGGSVNTGRAVFAIRALGADFAYIGTPWLAATEANVDDAYRQALIEASSADVVYTDHFTGVKANFLASGIRAAGLDPTKPPPHDPSLDYHGGSNTGKRVWLDVWSAGQGVHSIRRVEPAAAIAHKLIHGFRNAVTTMTTEFAETGR